MTTRVLWFVLGAVAMFAFLKRQAIRDIIDNRRTISSGAAVVEGAQQAWGGLSGLWQELRN